MNITRQALDMLKKLGRLDLLAEAYETLHDPIDIDRDANLLAHARRKAVVGDTQKAQLAAASAAS
jgi:hypothetical protein